MINKQIDLFTKDINITEDSSTLHITYEDKRVEMSIEEIFDAERFDSFIGVTYSITPEFMNEY